jgi:hypothetical protein
VTGLYIIRIYKLYQVSGPISISSGIWSSLCNALIIFDDNPRRRFIISDTRAGDPINGSRSFRFKSICSMRKRIASIGSGESIGKCLAS